MNYRHTLYQGPGRFGGEIVVFATTRSNAKVGGSAGLVIHDAHLPPAITSRPGAEWFAQHKATSKHLRVACGGCQLGARNVCFVQSNVQNASQPAAARRDPEDARFVRAAVGRNGIRSAVAGDAGALPEQAWQKVEAVLRDWECEKWLAYTHAWRDAHWLRDTHVASVDSLADFEQARDAGWRTFLTLNRDQFKDGVAVLPAGTFLCPASVEAANKRGWKPTCADCFACQGVGVGKLTAAHPSAAIARHSLADSWRKRVKIYDARGRLVGYGASVDAAKDLG